MQILDTDFLVIGGGLAGLTAALKLSARGRVLVAVKKEPTDSNTSHAQGGIACVMDADDTFAGHIQDTLTAGAGLCHRDVVEAIVTAGPTYIRELEKMGHTVAFIGPDQFRTVALPGYAEIRMALAPR